MSGEVSRGDGAHRALGYTGAQKERGCCGLL